MAAPPKNFEPRSMDDITDEVIVSRMDEKMMKKVYSMANQKIDTTDILMTSGSLMKVKSIAEHF